MVGHPNAQKNKKGKGCSPKEAEPPTEIISFSFFVGHGVSFS